MAIVVGLIAAAAGKVIQGRSDKKAAKKANRLSPAQLETLKRSQDSAELLFSEFGKEVSGTFGPKERKRAREDAEFFAKFQERGQQEALRSNLSFLAGTGLLRSGRAFQMQARGAAEIDRTREATARQVFEQRRQTAFNRKLSAASILQGFIGGGESIANRPQVIPKDNTGAALSSLGGSVAGLFSQPTDSDVDNPPPGAVSPSFGGSGAGSQFTQDKPFNFNNPSAFK